MKRIGFADKNSQVGVDIGPEVGKEQLKAQCATSTTSAIAEDALRFSFLFCNIREVALRTKVF